MEQLIKHIQRYGIYYSLLITVSCITYIIYLHSHKKDGFQDIAQEPVENNSPAQQASEEICLQLKSQIDNYIEIKEKHKDILITNMDETLDMLKGLFTKHGCETYGL
jgi:hypothetical protein